MFDPGEGRQKNSEFLSRAVHRVVGPAMGAITLAHDLALRIDHLTYNDCTSAFVEKIKDPVTGQKKMVFNRTNIKVGETILLCEDVLTTGGSVEMAENTVVSAGGTVMPYVLVLVNRSGLTEVNGKKIIALINSPMLTWDAEDCPLCKLGSEAILPKTPAENWVRLNARY